jgi:hypothetical protein
MSDERMQILRMIEEKRITPQEGIELMEALSGVAEESWEKDDAMGEEETASSPFIADTPFEESELPEDAAPPDPDWEGFRHLWLIPLVGGGVLSAVGLGIATIIHVISPGSFFLVCGLMPFLLGLATIVLAFWSRTARWLHVRIRGEQRISLGFPLPLRLTAGILRLVRPYVPQLEETGLDEVILSLDEDLGGEGGFYVDVHDDEDGERVQVYIG